MISFFLTKNRNLHIFLGGGGGGGVEWKGCSVAWVSEFFLQIIQL